MAARTWPIIEPSWQGYHPNEVARRNGEEAGEYLKRILASTSEAQSQMELRAGPFYELSRDNSRLISEAWRASGSPRKPAGGGLRRTERGGWERIETPEWQAWRAWLRQREQLRREHGMRGSGGVHYGRMPGSDS